MPWTWSTPPTPSHFIVWKRNGWLAPFVPEDVAKFYPADHKEADGLYASFRIGLCIIAYNTNLVKKEEAPKSFADLLDPKWKGKILKAHPGYSGTIMTATFEMQRDLGWGYLEKLAAQNVMQLQSSADPPKKLALGERAVQADGNEYNIFQLKEAGRPVEPVYATEGTPLVVGPNGVFKEAPNPNAARLFQCFCFSGECQQLISDVGGQRSVHPAVKEKAGRKPFKEIKTMKEDAAGVEKICRGDQGALRQDFQGLRSCGGGCYRALSLAGEGCSEVQRQEWVRGEPYTPHPTKIVENLALLSPARGEGTRGERSARSDGEGENMQESACPDATS